MSADFLTAYAAALEAAVARVDARVRQCPQCGARWLRRRKEEYCSLTCGQRARWARYAPHRPPRDYRRERAQAAQRKAAAPRELAE